MQFVTIFRKVIHFQVCEFSNQLESIVVFNQAGVTCQIPDVLKFTSKKIYEHVSSFKS